MANPSNKNGKGKSSQPPIKPLKSRAWRGAARELRVGSRDSQPGLLMGKIWKRRGELRAGGRGPRGGCARGGVGSAASCSSPAAHGARSALSRRRAPGSAGLSRADVPISLLPQMSHSKKNQFHLESLIFPPRNQSL